MKKLLIGYRICGLIAILFGAVLLRGGAAHAQGAVAASDAQKLALRVKPAVVRVIAGCTTTYVQTSNGTTYKEQTLGTGSGFFVNPSGYVVTNAHVVEDVVSDQSCETVTFIQFAQKVARANNIDLRTLSPDQQRAFLGQLRASVRVGRVEMIRSVQLANGTLLPYSIAAYGMPFDSDKGEGKDVAVVKVSVTNAPVLKLGDTANVRVQDKVYLIGYPGAADVSDADLEASVTSGEVSATDKKLANGVPVLQYTAATSPGSSGSPVLNSKGEVVAIHFLSGNNTFRSGHWTSTIAEFLTKANTTNQEGPTDQLYREGLDLYWAQKYTAAKAKFEQVKQLFPIHSEATQLIADCTKQIASGNEKLDPTPAPVSTRTPQSSSDSSKGGGGVPTTALLVAGLVGAAGTVTAFTRRGKGRTPNAPAPVAPVTTATRQPAVTRPASLPAGYCSACGAEQRQGMNFCSGCGAPNAVAA